MTQWPLSAAGLKRRLKAWRALSSTLRVVLGVLAAACGVAGPSRAEAASVGVLTLPLAEICREAPAAGQDDIARRLIVKVWYPKPSADGPAFVGRISPMLLFNAGWAGSSQDHFNQIQQLVARGFVVISVDHRLDLDEYDQFLDFSSGEALARTKVLVDRKTQQFALDNIAVFNLLQRGTTCELSDEIRAVVQDLDFSRAGIFGYSFGGAVAAQTAWLDPRFKAALNLDGWLFAEAATQGVVQPFMEISDDTPTPTAADLASTDVSKRLVAQLNEADYRQLRANMNVHGGYYLVVSGSNHESFVDVSGRSLARQLAALMPGAHRIPKIINAYIVTFFARYVAGMPSALIDQLPSPYKEVRVEFSKPPVVAR